MAERPEFRAPKGTQDVLPPESARWEALLGTLRRAGAHRFGYGLIQSPMFEDIGVFQRLGEGTDVVAKEMYDFEDKGGRHIALRPEGTARWPGPSSSTGPDALEGLVRHAGASGTSSRRPAGYRQHHQVGIEASARPIPTSTSRSSPSAHAYLAALGLRQFRLVMNSLGTPADRAGLRRGAARRGCAPRRRPGRRTTSEDRAHPLRVLDSKRTQTRAVLADAPRMVD